MKTMIALNAHQHFRNRWFAIRFTYVCKTSVRANANMSKF